jgi:type II secretory pathway component GspD/PulD (secretin)
MRQKLMVLVLALTVGTAAFAASQGAPKAPAVADKTVSLDYKMGDIQTVFKDIAHQAGANLQADSGIGGKVSLTMQNAQLSKVMDLICQNFHCTWKVEPGNPPRLVIASVPNPAH